MPLQKPIEFLCVRDIARKEKIKIEKIFREAGFGTFPLFVPMPPDLCAYRIDVKKDDLASRTQLFVTPEYDLHRPVLLRLKPADCAKLATEESIEATDFPYAICHVDGEFPPATSDDERSESAQRFTVVQIPPNQEVFPTQLDEVQVCWRLFQPDTEDLSDFRHLTVSPEMVVTRSDYQERITALKKTGSRKSVGKSTDRYTKRFEENRGLLMKAAEEIARTNPDRCDTLRKWANEVFDMRESAIFEELRKAMDSFSYRWVKETLDERYEFVQGKPVRKTFATPV